MGELAVTFGFTENVFFIAFGNVMLLWMCGHSA